MGDRPIPPRPAKKAKLLDGSDDDSSDAEGGGSLKVNEEFARRFEHNKKREEKHRSLSNRNSEVLDSEEDSEDDEDEDDDGELATEALDADIMATLQAIRSKDPRVFDKDATFYRPIDDDYVHGTNATRREKPMTLKEYHTKNLLEGKFNPEDEDDTLPKTYAQEQEEARQNLVKEMHAAGDSDGEGDDFLVAKSKSKSSKKQRMKITEEDVENADKDPETFLSNFMAARAWVPTDGSHFKPLESDDDDEDDRADDFENAYNLYFEDPSTANEKLVTYARDAVASTSVRRDKPSNRQKARDAARAKREAERKQREEELARLRKLRIDEVEEKVKRIRKTAGVSGKQFKIDEWRDVLEADWSDDQWDDEMRNRFGDAYYNAEDREAGSGSDEEIKGKYKRLKKPKWDDDIDIKDLVPDFDDDNEQPVFTLSSDDEDDAVAEAEEGDEEEHHRPTKSSKKRKQERADTKRDTRRDRRIIESLVDSTLNYETTIASRPKPPTQFRYRETSPTTFGLTPRDILLANDTQLNEFAGLKKLAAFRDPGKKKKDKKYLSKKARLRQWRMETFGDEEGPKGGFELLLGDEGGPVSGNGGQGGADGCVDIREGGDGKKKKRSKKRKATSMDA
ncbi:Krr1-domain-containing protein [Lindgomyces ingoldianus]|uniref:Krr1-domain-containing protein n=1 Tax=Lindgomyces ingoldianus TaxID=673940 RepID=A0ACB6QCD1_9PLEO|nr:Krr1-domain-containing protein [Lindgomyces ingoldianus]KAF2464589.1 Krr1-domain-containing protein [Lindgomyces ingoldianus]